MTAEANANISILSDEIDISADASAFIDVGFDVGIKKYEPVYNGR